MSKGVSQAAEKKLFRTTYMVLKHSITHERYELLVYLTINGIKLVKFLKNILGSRRNMRNEIEAKILIISWNT